MASQSAGFEQVARGVQVHLCAELEVLLGTARDERREMEYRTNVGRDQRARELGIGDVADNRFRKRHRGLVGRHDVRAERTHQCGTNVARGAGDEYSHARSYSKEEDAVIRAFLLALTLVTAQAWAQAYPAHTVKVVV